MTAVIVVEIIVGIVILVGAVRYAVRDARQRQDADLRPPAGSEYELAAPDHGELLAAQHRGEVTDQPELLNLRPLGPDVRDHYAQRWEAVQAEFVNQPEPMLDEADRLVMAVMRDRGYPVEDFNEHADLVAAEHPQVVEHYFAARAARHAHAGHSDAADTDYLQQAFEHYRALFDELVYDRQATSS